MGKIKVSRFVALIGVSSRLSAAAFGESHISPGSRHCVASLEASSQPGSADCKSIDLGSFFKPKYQSASSKLSPSCIVDMVPGTTASSTKDGSVSSGSFPLRQSLFSSPLISVLYERVLPPLWEAGLRIGGPDAEYRAAAGFLSLEKQSSDCPRILLDLSCGTGFVGQRFALDSLMNNGDNYEHVFALDFSSQMLGELVNSLRRRSARIHDIPISIIRGDAGSLPFHDATIDAIHWGAAMHCVPDAEKALREIFRVLKPGGRLYATTFLRPFPDIIFRFFTVEEMKHLAQQAGFGNIGNSVSDSLSSGYLHVEGKGVYGILKAVK